MNALYKMDFGSTEDTVEVKQKLNSFQLGVDNIGKLLEVAYTGINPEELHIKDRVNYDLFLAYALNTLYWMYLRAKGIDPNNSEVKKELGRVRMYMVKAKNAIQKHTLRQKVNQEAAGRFIKHGLGYSDKESAGNVPAKQQNKKNQKRSSLNISKDDDEDSKSDAVENKKQKKA